MRLDEALAALPLIAILRGLRPPEAVQVAGILYDAGFRVVEVPLNSPAPLDSIARIAAHFAGRLVTGAGTVVESGAVPKLAEAGAELVVAPNFDRDVVGEAVSLGLAALPGVLSASEAFAALAAGAAGLKLFPAEMVPPPALKALRAVLDPATIVLPVGGISLANMAAYRDAGASGFGIGSSLYKPGMSTADVGETARRWVAAWRSASTAAPTG